MIHAAGTFGDGLIRLRTRERVESVLTPKLVGTIVLFDLFKDTELDFLILFSSLTSILTPYAVADHSAANAFLDAFGAFANRQARFRTVTINWPGWKDVGQLANLEDCAGSRAHERGTAAACDLPGRRRGGLQRGSCTRI